MKKLNLSLSSTTNFLLILAFLSLASCDLRSNSGSTVVDSSVSYRGKFRKTHVRRKVSTDKNAFRNRTRSRYYYHTKGKYRRRR